MGVVDLSKNFEISIDIDGKVFFKKMDKKTKIEKKNKSGNGQTDT